MSAEQILKRYEEDTCGYCHSIYNNGVILYSNKPLTDPHDSRVNKISAFIISGELLKVGPFNDFELKKINYCPMCGKYLGD